MNKMLPFLALAMGAAFGANATEVEQTNLGPKQGWYVGLEVIKADVAINEVNEVSYDLDAGVQFAIGYDKKISDAFLIGIEGEYVLYGSKTFGQVAANSTAGVVMADVEASFSSFGLNIRPKYYVANSNFYVGGLLGFASTSYEYELTKEDFKSASLDSDTNTGINYGVEVGYEFDSGWMLQGGYRGVATEFNDVNVDITALYFGGRYKF
ncbi:porin family protein [Vibrio vulnificus]|nr:porin family protein [Vibrio vulnificus]ELP5727994.1 porin family protein [Vibrio vulnificus]MCU8471241.1 porin family protein [Vibrio vulnificus]